MRLASFILFAGALLIPSAAAGQEVRVYVTSQAGDRIAAKLPLHFGAGSTA